MKRERKREGEREREREREREQLTFKIHLNKGTHIKSML